MESATCDEIIINTVRENACLYDKNDQNFKDKNLKKYLWTSISANLKTVYNFDMPAEAVERRWSSLRDMFSRENRKRQSQPSGAGCGPQKEWELYRSMLFLTPHIAHRRSKARLSLPQPSGPRQTKVETNEMSFDESTSGSVPSAAVDHTYSDKPPEQDAFTQRRVGEVQLVERQLSEANLAISAAMDTVSTLLASQNENNGYMRAIEEGLQHVPGKHKTQCLIEMLQVIQKYEERE